VQPDWPSLKDKVVLVTGASRGVGARVATLLGEARARVVVNYRNKGARAEEVAEEVRRLGGHALTARADLTKRDELRRMMSAARKRFGNLDVLILNASGGLEKDVPGDYAMTLNRDAQTALGQRQQYVQQTIALESLYRDIVKALAELAVKGNDPQLIAILRAQGLSVTIDGPAGAAPASATAAPSTTAAAPARKPEKAK